MPRFNFSTLPGDLPLMLKVHLTSDDIPNSLVSDYQNFNNVEIGIVDKSVRGAGVPYSAVDQAKTASFRKNNRSSCSTASLGLPHYLDSILFSSSVASNYYLHQSMTIEFFNFDGEVAFDKPSIHRGVQ